jgi:hypothetical protein
MKPEAKLQGHPAAQRAQTGVPGRGADPRAVDRLREALGALIDLSGLSRRQIEQRLSAHGRGIDLTRLLNGRFEIKVRHVFDLSDALGCHPLEIFRLVLGEPQERSPLLQRIANVLAFENLLPPPYVRAAAHPAPAAWPAAARQQDLEQRLEALMEQLEGLAAAMGLAGKAAPAKNLRHPQ